MALLNELGAQVWYDKIDVFIGDNFVKKIYQGLEQCSHLIVILSRNSISSRWVQEELETFFKDLVEGGKTKIYPFLLEDVWQQAPKFLQKYQFADFRGSTADKLNPDGVAEGEREFRGTVVLDGDIFKCYHAPDGHRILVTLPKGKSKTQINKAARPELEDLREKLVGAHVTITGGITVALAIMVGVYLANRCKSITAYNPRGEEDDFVPVFLPG